MMALNVRNDWRADVRFKTVEQSKPWRPILLMLATAFAVAGVLFLKQPNLAQAAFPAPPPPPPAAVEAPPPPVAPVAETPLAPEAVVATSTPSTSTATTASTHKKRKHPVAASVAAVSSDELTRRALLKLQRAQLDRATSSP